MFAKLGARLEMLKHDRGEGPIPHVVMIAMMVTAAIVIGGMLLVVARGWVAQIDTTP